MSTQTYTLTQFADLLKNESSRGIINGGGLMQTIAQKGIPKVIRDVRGAVRMSIERLGENLEVTQYMTETVKDSILEVR